MQDCTHLSRFALVSTVFPMQKRKKVHRLLYHNLCTNVAAGEGFERRFRTAHEPDVSTRSPLARQPLGNDIVRVRIPLPKQKDGLTGRLLF